MDIKVCLVSLKYNTHPKFKGGRPWFFAIRFFKVLIKKPDCLRSHKIGFYFENRVLIGCGLQKRATHSVFRGGQLAVWLALNLRSSCSSRATWVRSTVVRRATTIPARMIPIMPALINVTRNKTMVLIPRFI